jgi:hypothetical protein
MVDGNCVGADPDQFHQDEISYRRGIPATVPPEVGAICTACMVRVECLAYALKHDEWGVWGGTTREQREAMRRPIVRAKCPACQSRNLLRMSTMQVCGDCSASWEATQIHGQRRTPPAEPQPQAGPATIIPFPVRIVRWEQLVLFDVAVQQGCAVRVHRRMALRRRRRQFSARTPLPGLAA